MRLKIPFLILVLFFPLIPVSAQKTTLVLSSGEEIAAEIAATPCKKREERLAAAKALFIKKGAAESDISVENASDTMNLVVTKNGSTDEIVVVGAHYDKTSDGCGALDNWSGIIVIANLYRTWRMLDTKKTYVFVAFDKEETGLRGSKAMADKIKEEERKKYCAMVNFDSFGFTYPQVMTNTSTPSLTKLAEEASSEMKIPFAKAAIESASADSESYRKLGIPAISMHGLNESWPSFLHTGRDKAASVNSDSVVLGYRHGLVLLSKIEDGQCSDLRK